MTHEQTRQLAIEFERRVQLLYPQEKFVDKLNSDTIFSLLNEYQLKYIKALYLAKGSNELNRQQQSKLSNILDMLSSRDIKTVSSDTTSGDDNSVLCDTPEDYFLYIRSTSFVDRIYLKLFEVDKPRHIANLLIKQEDADKIIDSWYNKGYIMRKPCVITESISTGSNAIRIIHDSYTSINKVEIIYYRLPKQFSITEDCELPESCFDELVDGAILLFVQYKTGLQPQRKEQKKEDE